jgi:hypothetical protein
MITAAKKTHGSKARSLRSDNYTRDSESAFASFEKYVEVESTVISRSRRPDIELDDERYPLH